MPSKLDHLRSRRSDLAAQLATLHDNAGDRNLTRSESGRWSRLTAEVREVDGLIEEAEAEEARATQIAADRHAWGSLRVSDSDTAPRSFGDLGRGPRYGTWLASTLTRANTMDTSTMSGKGRAPLGNEVMADWWDLVRPQSKLLDGFPWLVHKTEATQVDIPKIKADGPASATNEGADITGNTGADVEGILVTPTKYTSYEAISREAFRDATPSLLDAYARGITKRHALAWEAALVAALEASATVVATDANFATNLDVISDTIVTMLAAGAQPSGIVTTAAVAQTLLKVKEVSGSTKPVLMNSGPADGFAGNVLGLPLVVSSAVTATKAVIFDAAQSIIVVRESPTIEVSTDALFGTDSVAVRAVSRMAAKLMNATGAYILTDSA